MNMRLCLRAGEAVQVKADRKVWARSALAQDNQALCGGTVGGHLLRTIQLRDIKLGGGVVERGVCKQGEDVVLVRELVVSSGEFRSCDKLVEELLFVDFQLLVGAGHAEYIVLLQLLARRA